MRRLGNTNPDGVASEELSVEVIVIEGKSIDDGKMRAQKVQNLDYRVNGLQLLCST
jgi:hypothetical protein